MPALGVSAILFLLKFQPKLKWSISGHMIKKLSIHFFRFSARKLQIQNSQPGFLNISWLSAAAVLPISHNFRWFSRLPAICRHLVQILLLHLLSQSRLKFSHRWLGLVAQLVRMSINLVTPLSFHQIYVNSFVIVLLWYDYSWQPTKHWKLGYDTAWIKAPRLLNWVQL